MRTRTGLRSIRKRLKEEGVLEKKGDAKPSSWLVQPHEVLQLWDVCFDISTLPLKDYRGINEKGKYLNFWNCYNSDFFSQSSETWIRQWFGEEICQLLFGIDVRDVNLTCLLTIPDEIVLDINVLSPFGGIPGSSLV